MTHSTYHSEEGRVRSYSVMRLSVGFFVLNPEKGDYGK